MSRKTLFIISLLIGYISIGNASGTIIPRLSPVSNTTLEGRKLSLNGEWSFNPSPGKSFPEDKEEGKWNPIQVPGEWTMQGFKVEKGEAAGYIRSFILPDSWKGLRIKLRCNGVYSDSKVFINNKEAGAHLGGFTPFELDVTDLVSFGMENQIALRVISESLADSTSSASTYAVHPLGGITRDIYLFALPEVNFSMFHTSTAFDSTYMDAILKTEIGISNESTSPAKGLSVHFILEDAEGKNVSFSTITHSLQTIESGQTQDTIISLRIPRPQKWDSEHPYLYRLTCQLKDQQKVISTTSRRVGFRQIEIRKNQVFVNNKPIKLRGVCRHEVMPLRGRSLNGDIWRKDVELFRRGNVNYIRTSHYPPDEALLDACDELGMFVEVEAPFCWAHQTDVPADKHYAVLVNQHIEMINRDRSHPSILMWSMGNESLKFTEYFKQAADEVKKLDPTRPRIFSQWGPDGDEGHLEITNHHYPGPSGPAKYQDHERPVTFDEFCHLNAYNRLELAADPGLRNMWGELLDAMWNDMYYSKGVLGGAIWVGIDDTFFLPGEKAVGYGTWGTIDGWRREKPEYWGMKKAYSPVKVALKGNMDKTGKIRLQIENRHLFSNLSECQLTWIAGEEQGNVSSDIAPGSKGEVEIQLPEKVRDTRTLELVITGVRRFEIDRYHIQVLPEHLKPQSRPKAQSKIVCQESDEAIDIRTDKLHYTISKRSGLLSAQNKGKEIFRNAPTLMVLPLNNKGEGIQMTGRDQNFTPYNPICENWVAQSIACVHSKKEVEVIVCGSYKEAEGKLIYHFYPDGEITVTYDFTLSHDVSPRQTGLVFNLPASFTHLDWKRKGYWSVYPENHIGSLEGHAEAFDHNLPISGLAGPVKAPSNAWSFDQTANGSNLFRSTKTNIYQAVLSGDKGEKVTVLSDGTQHFRAWMDQNAIRFLIADYNNAGSDNFLVSHAEKGYRPLRKGDKVKGTIRLKWM
ncbi:glycoside hydrolase family 2 TIM barrel-domain containing protein [Parabacteroides sp.]